MKINKGQNLNHIKWASTPKAKQEVTLGGGDGFQKSAIDSPLEADQLKSMKADKSASRLFLGMGIMIGGSMMAASIGQPALMPIALFGGMAVMLSGD